MSLTTSNTYVEPTAGTALNTARLQQNDSYRSLLTNFKSTARPIGVNITSSGTGIGEQDGMLFRSATTNALYISDTVHKKSSPVGGNFTRIGIGNRVENGIVALGANATSYEIGELVATVSENGTLAANSRLYLCVSNTLTAGSTVGFLDVGSPQGYTIGTLNNVAFSGQSVTAISFLATANVGIGTSSPITALDVVGDITLSDKIIHSGDTNTTIRFPAADTVAIETAGTERMRVIADGNVGIGTSSPAHALDVTGTVRATTAIFGSPTFTGVPISTTATAGTNNTQIATTAFVTTADALKANIAGPTFTGVPAAPTASPGTNTTQIATTAFVTAGVAAGGSITLLGTLTTTSGSSQTLSSLVLTSYKFLRLVFVGVGTTSDVGSITVGGSDVYSASGSVNYVRGIVDVDLTEGTFSANLSDGGGSTPYAGDCTLTTASTSVVVAAVNLGNFNAGSIRVYGVK